MSKFQIYPDTEMLARAAADYLFERIRDCLARKQLCHVALPGGRSPARCLELLAELPLPWDRIHWYLGDERCYPPGHAQRNDTLVRKHLWSKIDSPAANQHPIPAELGPEPAAAAYAGVIQAIGTLDIVLLGMGEDGHTASLFPENAALEDERLVVPVFAAPKSPAERVSLGLTALQAAGERVGLVAGAGKREALQRLRDGEQLPIARVGPVVWFIDEDAV
ncbi:MAG: 6-phosphogluconolactonase [Gammaproteobacteria bacterium]|nr:6-phosphogluconolactonase [Gammaproteobacteria bacterium]MDH3560020.1 6-phosphogluconolactonase [Gammaproteobacteria bacterium]